MTEKNTLIIAIFLKMMILPVFFSGADPLFFPEIRDLHPRDPAFSQAVAEIEHYYRAKHRGEPLPQLSFFRYHPQNGDDLLSVSARFNLPYESIALLNGIRSPDEFRSSAELLIPSQVGLFIPREPRNDLDRLVSSWRSSTLGDGSLLRVHVDGRLRELRFLEGEKFHPLERSFFFNTLFRFPLPSGVVSSHYGERYSPINRKLHFHHGIDIAAPGGTEVYAAAAGRVSAVKNNDILGNFIVILHRGDFSTLYGHLRKVSVQEGDEVRAGSLIATVGSTGLSTGPHLHFEIRNAGESWNPSEILQLD